MQLKELKESSSAIPPHLTNTAIPYSYTTIRNTSHTLYETLKAAWTCGNADHVKHYAKLKVDTTEQADVTLRLAIMSQKQCARQLGRWVVLHAQFGYTFLLLLQQLRGKSRAN